MLQSSEAEGLLLCLVASFPKTVGRAALPYPLRATLATPLAAPQVSFSLRYLRRTAAVRFPLPVHPAATVLARAVPARAFVRRARRTPRRLFHLVSVLLVCLARSQRRLRLAASSSAR